MGDNNVLFLMYKDIIAIVYMKIFVFIYQTFSNKKNL